MRNISRCKGMTFYQTHQEKRFTKSSHCVSVAEKQFTNNLQGFHNGLIHVDLQRKNEPVPVFCRSFSIEYLLLHSEAVLRNGAVACCHQFCHV